jgi:prevent-host-death family protein
MAVSVFKAHALQAVDRVAKTLEGIVITKRGKPLVQVLPYRPHPAVAAAGKLSETLVFEKDIVSPLGPGMWEAARGDT